MKKIRALILLALLSLSLCGCQTVYRKPNDYHMIYDNVVKANESFIEGCKKDTLLDWDAYCYCSYFLLFPREQPEQLQKFYYYWLQAIDYDDYAIYFTYQLDQADYQRFKEQLSGFTIEYDGQVNRPIYTESTFEYPTYILSWTEDVESSGLCEYIMLDDQTCTVINVYKMFYSLEDLQANADYPILPKNGDYTGVEAICGEEKFSFAKHKGYSVYAFRDQDQKMFVPDPNKLNYDNTFLESP